MTAAYLRKILAAVPPEMEIHVELPDCETVVSVVAAKHFDDEFLLITNPASVPEFDEDELEDD